MISCLVFVLPPLELATTALYRRSPVRPLPLGQLPLAPSSALHRAQSPLELRSSWTLSDILVLTLYILYNVFALLVPLWYYDVSEIYWEAQIPPGAPPLTTAARWAYAVGAMAGWPCMGNMGLAMFPVSRCSPLMAILGAAGYQQLLWIHKLAGRLAFLWLSVHGEGRAVPWAAPQIQIQFTESQCHLASRHSPVATHSMPVCFACACCPACMPMDPQVLQLSALPGQASATPGAARPAITFFMQPAQTRWLLMLPHSFV
jgi:hypothetical protein